MASVRISVDQKAIEKIQKKWYGLFCGMNKEYQMARVKRTFSIPEDISDQLDQVVPTKERSKFIAATLREALREENRKRLLVFLDEVSQAKNPNNIQSEDILRNIRPVERLAEHY